MTLTAYDAAYPPATPPATDVVCCYSGGDTPHVWTLAEIDAQTARYRLPIWVRSDPAGADAATDAAAFVAQLHAIGCPTGVCTVLDLETAIDAAYVDAFGTYMHNAGWLVLPYGSSSTLDQNPVLDGYWVAEPGASAIPAGYVGVQYDEDVAGAYDLSWFSSSLSLWDTSPTPDPPTPTPTTESEMGTVAFAMREDQLDVVYVGNGQLWHKWNTGAWYGPENVWSAAGETGASPNFPDQTPCVDTALVPGQVVVTVQSDGAENLDKIPSAYWFAQGTAAGAKWGVVQL